jgi:hypothetical protein
VWAWVGLGWVGLPCREVEQLDANHASSTAAGFIRRENSAATFLVKGGVMTDGPVADGACGFWGARGRKSGLAKSGRGA